VSAPAGPGTLVPVSDEVAAHRLLQVQDLLGDLLCAVAPGRELIVDSVLVALDSALDRLGYRYPDEAWS
jgi:hypothetical protein